MDSVLFMCEYLKQCGNEAGRGARPKAVAYSTAAM